MPPPSALYLNERGLTCHEPLVTRTDTSQTTNIPFRGGDERLPVGLAWSCTARRVTTARLLLRCRITPWEARKCHGTVRDGGGRRWN